MSNSDSQRQPLDELCGCGAMQRRSFRADEILASIAMILDDQGRNHSLAVECLHRAKRYLNFDDETTKPQRSDILTGTESFLGGPAAMELRAQDLLVGASQDDPMHGRVRMWCLESKYECSSQLSLCICCS